eukprot:875552-Ditylum_brightwellii.AAC.1
MQRLVLKSPHIWPNLALIITNHVYDHICKNDILPPEQKEIKQKARGCKDHLVLDKVTLELTQQNKRNLSLAWIDYQKAYNLVPHSWISEVLETYKVESTLHRFIEKLIPFRRTKLNLYTGNDTITTKELFIWSGIFQGDSLSPLIFCIALFPLSCKLHQAGTGFRIGKHKVLHLLYINDLKMYAKNDEEMCAILTIVNGKSVETTILDDFPRLPHDEGYKYLGILESLDFHTKE